MSLESGISVGTIVMRLEAEQLSRDWWKPARRRSEPMNYKVALIKVALILGWVTLLVLSALAGLFWFIALTSALAVAFGLAMSRRFKDREWESLTKMCLGALVSGGLAVIPLYMTLAFTFMSPAKHLAAAKQDVNIGQGRSMEDWESAARHLRAARSLNSSDEWKLLNKAVSDHLDAEAAALAAAEAKEAEERENQRKADEDPSFARQWYGSRYGVPASQVRIETKPHNCDWDFAPLGKKGCHYEKEATAVIYSMCNVEGQPQAPQRPCVSVNNEKPSWVYPDGETGELPKSYVAVTWRRIAD